jgi:hypothetical protein
MHVLPLPFGLALAVIPRREADRLQRRETVRPFIRNAVKPRDRILGEVQSLQWRNHL